MAECESCTNFIALERRVIVIETEQKGLKDDIAEIKNSQKETRVLLMSTLITSVLGLIGLIFTNMG